MYVSIIFAVVSIVTSSLATLPSFNKTTRVSTMIVKTMLNALYNRVDHQTLSANACRGSAVINANWYAAYT